MRRFACSVMLGVSVCASAQTTPGTTVAPPPQAVPESVPAPSIVELIRAEAGRLMPGVRCAESQRFLIGTSYLIFPGERTLHRHKETRAWITHAEFESLPEDQRGVYESRTVSESEYYLTKYGSPLAYTRPVDVLCDALGGGYASMRGKKFLDYGYGGIGHLRLIASLGCEVVGVEVDPYLKALYSDPMDTGVVDGVPIMDDGCPAGKLTLVHGRWPADEPAVTGVGSGFDVVMSKNTLKNGYLNPERPVDKRMLIDLGVSQEEYLAKVAQVLKPGGLFLIYNICPGQNADPEKWIPWADGRSPFSRAMFEAAGFEIITFDRIDDAAARAMGVALEWNKGARPMDLEHDLFAMYTLVRKLPPAPPAATTPAAPPATP